MFSCFFSLFVTSLFYFLFLCTERRIGRGGVVVEAKSFSERAEPCRQHGTAYGDGVRALGCGAVLRGEWRRR